MTDQDQYEKDEKDAGVDEKGDEKVYEKQEEKSWDEKWRRDPLGSIAWAVILIWAGVVLLASNLNLMERLGPLAQMEAWSLIFSGAGLIMLFMVVIRLLMPEYRAPIVGSLIFAVILLAIGLGDMFGWGLVWALVLIVLGAAFLLRGVFHRG